MARKQLWDCGGGAGPLFSLFGRTPFLSKGEGCWKPAGPLPRPSLRLQHLRLLHREEKGMNSAVVSTAPHFLLRQDSPCGSPRWLSLLKMPTTGAGKEAGFSPPCPWGWGRAMAVQIPPLNPEFGDLEQGRRVYIKVASGVLVPGACFPACWHIAASHALLGATPPGWRPWPGKPLSCSHHPGVPCS